MSQIEICAQRGHESDEGYIYTSNPPAAKCKWCGTFFYAPASSPTTFRSDPQGPVPFPRVIPDGSPLGSWLHLDPALDVDTPVFASPLERLIAHGVQNFGMFVRDTGSVPA